MWQFCLLCTLQLWWLFPLIQIFRNLGFVIYYHQVALKPFFFLPSSLHLQLPYLKKYKENWKCSFLPNFFCLRTTAVFPCKLSDQQYTRVGLSLTFLSHAFIQLQLTDEPVWFFFFFFTNILTVSIILELINQCQCSGSGINQILRFPSITETWKQSLKYQVENLNSS